MLRNTVGLVCVMGLLALSAVAAAQGGEPPGGDDGSAPPPAGGDALEAAPPASGGADDLGQSSPPPDDWTPNTDVGDDQAMVEENIGVEGGPRDDTDPYEDPTQGYYFAGVFYRHTFVPSFLLELFTDDSTAANNPAFGAEFTYRKDGFDIVGSLWWAQWAVNGPFRASGDPQTDVEIIDSSLSTLFLTATFLWSTAFDDIFALEYGVGIGLGIVLGDLDRTEAYPDPGGTNGFSACDDVSTPNVEYCDGPAITGECDGEGGHYCTEPKWTGGGSVPNVVPWLAIPHLALRIKPIKQLMMRIEGGFGLGFFFGGSLSYGF